MRLLFILLTCHFVGAAKVAVLISGSFRALCTPEFYGNVQARVIRPTKSAGHEVLLFISTHATTTGEGEVPVDNGRFKYSNGDTHFSNKCSEMLKELRPAVLHLRDAADQLQINQRCPDAVHTDEHPWKFYTQFWALYQLYTKLVAYETFVSARVDYIIKLRTDTFLFENLPVQLLQGATTAYVPRGVMTCDPQFVLLNDHIFICPRDLCAPYFSVAKRYEECTEPLSMADLRKDVPQTHFMRYYSEKNVTAFDLQYTLMRQCATCGFTLGCARRCANAPATIAAFEPCLATAREWASRQGCASSCADKAADMWR